MPCRRAWHAHDLVWRLFFGLLFLENFDLSQLKKPPFAFNSNSIGKWSLTPSACKTMAQSFGSHPHSLQALPGCAALGRGEVAHEHCIRLGVMITWFYSQLCVQHCLDTAGSVLPFQPFPAAAQAVLSLPAPRSSEIPPGNQRC